MKPSRTARLAPGSLVCALALALAGAGCKRSDPPRPAPAPALGQPPAPSPTRVEDRPASAARKTTSSAKALRNLDAQITGAERAAAAPDADPGHTVMLVALLGARGKYLGRIADLERADRLADELVRRAPGHSAALLARASTRAALHRFDDALADLTAAAQAGAPADTLAGQRATIDLALGRTDAALVVLERAARDAPAMETLATLAAVYGQLGRTEEASALFARALAVYADVSPFAIAWLEFEEGQMWERAGQTTRARALYASAHTRLPAYAHATAHLALLEDQAGDRARAIALLEPLLVSSDDPEIPGLLSPLLRALEQRLGAATKISRHGTWPRSPTTRRASGSPRAPIRGARMRSPRPTSSCARTTPRCSSPSRPRSPPENTRPRARQPIARAGSRMRANRSSRARGVRTRRAIVRLTQPTSTHGCGSSVRPTPDDRGIMIASAGL